MEIKGIKQFMELCTQGSKTYKERRELLLEQKKNVEDEIERMERVLDMLKFKCWYYEQAIKDGNENSIIPIRLEDMPKEVLLAYNNAHKF